MTPFLRLGRALFRRWGAALIILRRATPQSRSDIRMESRLTHAGERTGCSKIPFVVAAEVTRLKSNRVRLRMPEPPHVGCHLLAGKPAGGIFSLFMLALAIPAFADDWPQWFGPQRDSEWRESGILKKFPATGLKVRWRTPIGPGYTGPAVANGRVFVMDRQLADGAKNPENPFKQGLIPGNERVICLDERNGKILWKHEYDCGYTVSYAKGPRATPTVDGDRVYTLGAEGNLYCLNVQNGDVIWSRDFKKDYGAKTPTWGFAAHPLVDGERLICTVGGDGSAVVAFDKRTGKEIWRALTTKNIAYCPPVIYRAGGTRQLIIWHISAIESLNPDSGEVYWTHPWAVRGGGAIAMPRKFGNNLFLSTFFNGSLMLGLDPDKPGVSELWRSPKVSEKDTVHLHALSGTPWLEAGHIYGVCNYGQFRCLRMSDGKRVWESLEPLGLDRPRRNATAFIIKHENRFFIVNDGGALVIARLSPAGFEEIDRTRLIEPTDKDANRPIVWSHPAFANRSVYARNDREIICASLAAE